MEDVSLAVQLGELLTLLGPSGCGKTTTLRLIAGLIAPTAGEIIIGGESMENRPPYRRPVNMVVQHDALFPHLTVGEHIAYGSGRAMRSSWGPEGEGVVPDFPIIDAHVHLWDPTRYEIPWLSRVPTLNARYEPAEYAAHTRGIEIEAFVYEEIDIAPDYRLLEVRQADAYAAADPRLRGIVASAPLEYGETVRTFLEALVRESPRVKGARRLLQGESDPAFGVRPEFVRGVELLAEFDLSFDICVYHFQLASAVELVRRLPNVRFVLDHIGKPAIRDGLLDPWRDHISELASLPNVVCKMSGVVTEADFERWTIADVAPYVQHVLSAFGEDRVMYASDWPVATQASTYTRWVETLDTLTADWPDSAKRKLWAENARAFYRLG